VTSNQPSLPAFPPDSSSPSTSILVSQPILSTQRRRVSALVPNEVKGVEAMLGSAFLKTFYGAFDLDRRTVSCEYPISV
jgi:hypothetical protein